MRLTFFIVCVLSFVFHSCKKKEEITQYVRFDADSTSYSYLEDGGLIIKAGSSIISLPSAPNTYYIDHGVFVKQNFSPLFSLRFYYTISSEYYNKDCIRRKYRDEFLERFPIGNYVFLKENSFSDFPDLQAKVGAKLYMSVPVGEGTWSSSPFGVSDTNSYDQTNSYCKVSSSRWTRNKDGEHGLHIVGSFQATLYYQDNFYPPIKVKHGAFSVFIPFCED